MPWKKSSTPGLDEKDLAMNFHLAFLLGLALTSRCAELCAQEEWTLRLESEGIRVYSRLAPHSSITEVRLEARVQASLTAIAAVLMDVDRYSEWIASISTSQLVARLSDRELVYYFRSELPWPFSDRESYAHMHSWQDPDTKTLYNRSNIWAAAPPPTDENVVRMPVFEAEWRCRPLPDGSVAITYHLRSDPGGALPAWLINAKLVENPLRSLKALRRRLTQPRYQNAHLAWIRE